ncbi:hypothetical protein PPTG_20631 [Phytophthora nicotianae INRA-310]|uniref:Uncharacterized protein n=1 Tax=Phytophthora nicotianae (strain INRA-310) TaxID=761204 RepID=W2RDV4_PHYN3|nr:hypothetical protein PPTG_20631 [Phytophthora nicotianae INRA-310]ETN23411.1 hypothetical protein PPTG_20631 [Phytophthora nicotianae INRA-310]
MVKAYLRRNSIKKSQYEQQMPRAEISTAGNAPASCNSYNHLVVSSALASLLLASALPLEVTNPRRTTTIYSDMYATYVTERNTKGDVRTRTLDNHPSL